jgi:hypothetical protein
VQSDCKLNNEEQISAEAEKHYEQTYNQLMPLLRSHSYTITSRIKRSREEEGDYSEVPDIVKACEGMYEHVTKQSQSSRVGSCGEART